MQFSNDRPSLQLSLLAMLISSLDNTPNDAFALLNAPRLVGRVNFCYHAALNAELSSQGKAVRPVRPSVKRVDGDKTEERSVQICIPYERSFSLVF